MNPPTTPFNATPASALNTPSFNPLATPTPATRGRQGSVTTGAKRGRKPRGGGVGVGTTTPRPAPTNQAGSASPAIPTPQFSHVHWAMQGQQGQQAAGSGAVASGSGMAAGALPSLDTSRLISLAGGYTPILPAGASGVGVVMGVPPARPLGAGDEDGDGEDEMLPAMADDDYSAQLSWQSQSKDNLKCVIIYKD